ncbi:MAG: hypothetical protein K2L96_01060 [Muribaculaceae bacterium]|nr:hypothetical protein [Muribaculaceae bacterium]
MILLSVFQSVEFYVIAAVMAAAVVAAAVKPRDKKPVVTRFYGGLLLDDGPRAEGEAASILLQVDEDGRELVLERRGLTGVNLDSGAYSVVVSVSGFDIVIEERLTFGEPSGPHATGAEVRFESPGPERFHFLYRSDVLGRNCAFTLSLRPGSRVERELV